MKLKKVTITGADDDIHPIDLVPLADKYPFVEFGILFSKDRQGSPRYPSEKWLIELFKVLHLYKYERKKSIAVSAHLCGSYVTELFRDQPSVIPWQKSTCEFINIYHFDRCQLNMTKERFLGLDIQNLYMNLYHKTNMFPVIITAKSDFSKCEMLSTNYQGFFHVLYDLSGGKGISPKEWVKPIDNVFCGMAGGLNPDNLAEELNRMAEVVGDTEIWIDAESGVRENDKFDLNKVERFLEISSTWTK
jgi:phosphoribosylanthranilate isomerase